MAFKQPRVPEFNEKDGVSRYLKTLVLFLKDFCQEAWMANRQSAKSVPEIDYPVTSVNSKTGDVELSASDVGALPKNGTAADSYKLGGKDSAYFHKKFSNPHNLLDNSDFRNPVNQRGSGHISSQYGYPIDRWIFDTNGSGTGTGYDATNKYLYIANNATDGSWGALYHSVPAEKVSAGTYTLVFHEKLIAPVSLLAIVDDTTVVLPSANYKPNENGIVLATFNIDIVPTNKLFIGVYAQQGDTVAFDWAALYKGEYTTETLPSYTPKGYDVEYLVCRRWFLPLPRWTFVFFCGSAATYSDAMISYGIPMYPIRAVNLSLGGVSGWYPVVQSSNSVRLRVDISTGWPNGYPIDVSTDGCYISSEL